MPGYCACAGCKVDTRLHGFPKDKATLRQWVHFVRVRRAHFSMTSVTANTKICSAHFKEDYDEEDARMVSLGLKTKRLAKLIPTTEPSAQHLSACRYHTERHQESRDATMLIDAAQQETADSVDVNDPLPSTCDTGTQCNVKPRGRSHAVQVNLKPKMVSVGTQTQTSPPSLVLNRPMMKMIRLSSAINRGCLEDICLRMRRNCVRRSHLTPVTPTKKVFMSLFALCPACCEKSDSLCIMWLPTFLAKPANAPQEHGVSYFGSHNVLQCSHIPTNTFKHLSFIELHLCKIPINYGCDKCPQS
ncbi:hypothetical protein N1851_009910 [Merluccius polli]|uniref:THAP domain-containing protein 1 n=1 Tax=Merluccius polli TaxID=89951 RepID=A0AA47P7H9_MERPO|nr:hypothetical protein N1851_009910 [Merluccius polli]